MALGCTVEEVYPLVRDGVSYYKKRFSNSVFRAMDEEDCIQEIILQMWRYRYFEKYDPGRKNLKNAIYQICYNWFLNRLRYRQVKISIISTSLDVEIEGEDGLCLRDMIACDACVDEDVVVNEVCGGIPDELCGLFVKAGNMLGYQSITLSEVARLLLEGISLRELRRDIYIYVGGKWKNPTMEILRKRLEVVTDYV